MNTAQDITEPLAQLLNGISRVKRGDYHFQLSFGREDELEKIAIEFNGMVLQLSEKDLLATMVSESAVEMAHSDKAEFEALQGRKRNAAVGFFGIAQFDSFLKEESLQEIRSKLGRWVEKVCTIVAANGGEVDKIMEGKILAVFFADTLKDADKWSHVDKVFTAAIQICNNEFTEDPPTSCGIHVGNVISGLMGNQDRRDFTVIGDPVNMAARCFSLSEKFFKTGEVIASQETIAELSDNFALVDLGKHLIKGKQEPIRLFKVSLANKQKKL